MTAPLPPELVEKIREIVQFPAQWLRKGAPIDEMENVITDAIAKAYPLIAAHVAKRLLIDPNSAAFGKGTEFEEAVIDAGTKYIVSTIGHYSIGDRRFTMGLYNTMLHKAIERELGGKDENSH